MSQQKTLCIIKPDALAKKQQGAILQQILDAGLTVVAMRQLTLTPAMAQAFYAVHSHLPFFPELVSFMTSGPIIVAALEGDDAVARYRTLVGATNPANAAEGTLRQRFGTELGRNAVHGSDSAENGVRETSFFFPGHELP